MTSGIATVSTLRPDAAGALRQALDEAFAVDHDGLLALCRARVRRLLGGDVDSDDPRLLAVGDYATSPLFTATERLVLEFAEQYVLDVAGMPDDLVGELQQRLGSEALYALAMGLYAVDQAERLERSAAVHPGVTR